MTAVQSEQRELQAASMQPSDTPTDMITSPKDASTAGPSDDATISGTADAAQSTVSLTSADAACRKSAACARTVLEAERTILAAASKTLRTYVICPGILYGEQKHIAQHWMSSHGTCRAGCALGNVSAIQTTVPYSPSIHCAAYSIKSIGKAGHCKGRCKHAHSHL